MKVLHVIEAVGHGTGRYLRDLVAHATSIEHVAVLPAAPTGRGEHDREETARALAAAGVPVVRVPMRRSPLHLDLLQAIDGTARAIEVHAADVLFGHASMGGLVARMAGRRTGRPVAWAPNGLHPSMMVRGVERALSRWVDLLVAVSASEATAAVAAGLVGPGRVVTIPNGIDLEPPPASDRDLRAELGVPVGGRLVGWVGRLARQKGPDLLVQAMAHLPATTHAALAGGGPWHDRILHMARRATVANRVHLLGHVPRAAGLLPQFDVLAQPSRWEGGPYVPLEAFRAGVPVVATNVVGNRDIVIDGQTGWLVPPEDPAALAAAIEAASGSSPTATAVTSRARRRLVDTHDVREAAAATATALAGLTGTCASAR